MTKKRRTSLARVRGFFVAAAVAVVFLLPAAVTAGWLGDVVFGNDPRKTVELPAFTPRPADQTGRRLAPFNEPIVSVTFDDGWESAYSAALPLMQRYGIRSTQYILAEQFDNPAYLSQKQVRALLDAGHEINSHTINHLNLTELEERKLVEEVAGSKEILARRFPIGPDFAPPLGAANERTTAIIKRHYRSSRNTAADLRTIGPEDVNLKRNFNPYNINAYSIRSTTTLEELRRLLAYAREHKAWVVLTYHQIDYSGGHYSVTPETFEVQLRLLQGADIRSAPLGKVMDELERATDVARY